MRCANVFQAQVDTLLQIKQYEFTLEQHASGSQPEKSDGYDRFVLVQNYCGKQIRWNIILDQHNPKLAPDFIFEQDDFVIGTQISSFEKWDPSVPRALLDIIIELRQLMKDKQREFVKNYPDERVRFEFSTVQDLQGSEFFTCQKEVVMALPLSDVSLNDVPGENEPKPILFVKFYPDSTKTPETSLTLPPNWSSNEPPKIELPKWTREMCLVDYVPLVKDILKKLVAILQIKRQLVDELVKSLGSPYEVDTKTYSSVGFIFDVSQYIIIVAVSIKNKFPQEPPQITFQSFTQFVRNKPYTKEWPDCPWSPRWSPQEMAKRLRSFIVEGLPTFKKHCSAL